MLGAWWGSRLWWMGFLYVGIGMTWLACSDDLYSRCNLDSNSENRLIRQCASSAEERSCAVEQFLQCETRVCARWFGGDPFCSQACQSDGDCGSDGLCREFVINSGKRFCIRRDLLSNDA